jgi:hypothetical protein
MATWESNKSNEKFSLDLVIFWANWGVKHFKKAYKFGIAPGGNDEAWLKGLVNLVQDSWQIIFIVSTKIKNPV